MNSGSHGRFCRAAIIQEMPRTYGKVRSQRSPLDKGQGRKEVGGDTMISQAGDGLRGVREEWPSSGAIEMVSIAKWE